MYKCLCSRDINVYYQIYSIPFSAKMLIEQVAEHGNQKIFINLQAWLVLDIEP